MLKLNDLTGFSVRDIENNKLRNISEVVFEIYMVKISYVILMLDYDLMEVSKYFAIPWRALRFVNNVKEIKINIKCERLKLASGIDPSVTNPSRIVKFDLNAFLP